VKLRCGEYGGNVCSDACVAFGVHYVHEERTIILISLFGRDLSYFVNFFV
jgi:hypothetical protein